MDRALFQDRRVWLGGGLVIALIVVAAGWFMLISPKLASADSLRQQNQDAQRSNSLIDSKNAKLKRESQNLPSLTQKLVDAAAGLPADTGFAEFTREVTTAAAARHVTLTTIAITAPTAQAAPVAATPTTTTESGSTSTPTTSPSAPTATSNTVSVNVTLTTSGSLAAQTAFLNDLQNGARRVLVTSSQVSVASGSRVNSVDTATSMTTQVTIFSSPTTATELLALKAALRSK